MANFLLIFFMKRLPKEIKSCMMMLELRGFAGALEQIRKSEKITKGTII